MKDTRPIEPGIAAKWLARMRDDRRTEQDEIRLSRWLAEDPHNEQEFERLQTLWASLERVLESPPIRDARAQALQQTRQDSVGERRSRFLRGRRWALAAGLVGVIGVAVLTYRYIYIPVDQPYQTLIGDRRIIQLVDGSELTLNTDTRVHVRYTASTRTVELERGQAHFKVAHRPLRPFLVQAGTSTVRALGTEFDVYRDERELRVTLVEGKVAVTPVSGTQTTLTPGQVLSLTARGAKLFPAARVAEATAWLDGKLVFNDEPLRHAVTEINRYLTHKILVLDEQLADQRVNGVFRTDRADTFVEAVRTSLPVLVESASDGTLVLVPDPARREKNSVSP